MARICLMLVVMELRGRSKAIGGVNSSRVRGDSSFFDSEGTQTSFNANKVITWLKHVGNARVDTFWKKYSFPPSVRVSFASSRPHRLTLQRRTKGE